MSAEESGGTQSAGLAGLRVVSLESRRGAEMARLIAHYGGRATVAPSMKEVPLESNTEAAAFVRALLAGGFDVVIFLTGVGARMLARIAETAAPLADFLAALGRTQIVARGPKPAAVLKEWGLSPALTVPEPNTWRDLLRVLDENAAALPLKDRRVAVQEYGASNPDLLAALAGRGARVSRVPVYQWSLPDDTGPLSAAVEAMVRGEVDLVLFTTSVQIAHLFRMAATLNLESSLQEAFARVAIGSIGPVTSEALQDHGLAPDFEPAHPKMGFLVAAAAERAAELVRKKRQDDLR